MKKVILAIAIMIGISGASIAQTTTKSSDNSMQKMKMNDGVMMVDNKTMLCNKSKCTSLTKTYTCSDGCKVSTDGTITKPDGSTMKLMNGSMIGKDGKVTMIPHGEKGHVCGESCPMHSKM